MWGSTTPNTASECTWTNAPFNNGSSDYDEEYFDSVKDTVYPNNVLAKEYDTVSQIMGGGWRMPTKAEFDELISNTTTGWIEDFNGSGVNGRKFTSKKDTSKYIFIPASGVRSDSSFFLKDRYCRVWSSSLSTPLSNTAFYLSSDSIGIGADNEGDRSGGFSIRGVFK